jgi:superoxide dismutase
MRRPPPAALEEHEPAGGGEPDGELATAIRESFGSFDPMRVAPRWTRRRACG